jgi:hypothetical protein
VESAVNVVYDEVNKKDVVLMVVALVALEMMFQL